MKSWVAAAILVLAASCGGEPEAGCGNELCDGAETCESCSVDCGLCTESCGDGVCEAAETCASCADDCGTCTESCGDGVCEGAETCESCSEDCGACLPCASGCLSGAVSGDVQQSVTITLSREGVSTTEEPVYLDALQPPWTDTSWNVIVDMDSASPVYDGSAALHAQQGGWGLLRLRHGGWATATVVDPAAYDTLELALHPDAEADMIVVSLSCDQAENGACAAAPSFPEVGLGPVTADAWNQISVALADLAPNGDVFDSLVISNREAADVVYSIDALRLTGTALGTVTREAVTDALGAYIFDGLEDGSYTVAPSLRDFTFAPPSRSVTLAGASIEGMDFTSTAAPACSDSCPAPNGGVTWLCKKRFMYGVNYAYKVFGGDFGGGAWGGGSVSAQPAVYAQDLADMRAHGSSTIRWWIFPDFRSPGITWDANGDPSGLTATAIADVQKALELAEQEDVYLMLTIFSFDNFRPTTEDRGVTIRGLQPMVIDATRRAKVITNVVRPLAEAVGSSPHARRMIAWDVINEPEWAMTKEANPYGDPEYEPAAGLEHVTHAQMETFVSEIITELRAHTSSLVSVGAAALKWTKAWSNVDTDFHQFHHYGWANDWYPYDKTPAEYGLDDKPVVMGEFPLRDEGVATGVSYSQVVSSWYDLGYAGAMSWQYFNSSEADMDRVKAFADTHSCETAY